MRVLNWLILLPVLFLMCTGNDQIRTEDQSINKIETLVNDYNRKNRKYNFKFIGYDININDPAWDRRSYYKIYIDKVDAGRTTIGLESQKKEFEANLLTDNRHLLIVEKWALDEKKGQYIKLNNIEQPKPDYVYFDLPEDKQIVVILKNDPFKNKSVFDVEYE